MKVTKTSVKTAAKAALRVAGQLAKMKSVLVPEATKQKRLSICEACGYRDGMQCSKCLCLIRAKTMLSTETCPDGKW
jgi:hypothetical protein